MDTGPTLTSHSEDVHMDSVFILALEQFQGPEEAVLVQSEMRAKMLEAGSLSLELSGC